MTASGLESVVATPGSRRGVQGLTRAELRALPAAINLDISNRALSLGRSTGYALAKRGMYPCKVLRVGNAYRVITTDLLRILEVEADQGPDSTALAMDVGAEHRVA